MFGGNAVVKKLIINRVVAPSFKLVQPEAVVNSWESGKYLRPE